MKFCGIRECPVAVDECFASQAYPSYIIFPSPAKVPNFLPDGIALYACAFCFDSAWEYSTFRLWNCCQKLLPSWIRCCKLLVLSCRLFGVKGRDKSPGCSRRSWAVNAERSIILTSGKNCRDCCQFPPVPSQVVHVCRCDPRFAGEGGPCAGAVV